MISIVPGKIEADNWADQHYWGYATNDGIIVLNSNCKFYSEIKDCLCRACGMSTQQLLMQKVKRTKKNDNMGRIMKLIAEVELCRRVNAVRYSRKQ